MRGTDKYAESKDGGVNLELTLATCSFSGDRSCTSNLISGSFHFRDGKIIVLSFQKVFF